MLLKGQLYLNIFLLHQEKQPWKQCPLDLVYRHRTLTAETHSSGRGRHYSKPMSLSSYSKPSIGKKQALFFNFPEKSLKWDIWWAEDFFVCMAFWLSPVELSEIISVFQGSMAISCLLWLRNKLVGPVEMSRYSHSIL